MKIVASILKSNPFSTNSRKVQLPWLYAVALILSVWLIADVNVQYANDSLHYMRAGELFLNGHIHDFRTPLYPIIFHLAQVITGRFAGEAVVILQIVLYLLSILAFYNIGRSLIKSPAILFTISLLYATHPGLILWNYFILTESLAISGAVILFYFILEFYKKPTLLLAIAIPARICLDESFLQSLLLLLIVAVSVVASSYVFLDVEAKAKLNQLVKSKLLIKR